jgi:hypothetical protein
MLHKIACAATDADRRRFELKILENRITAIRRAADKTYMESDLAWTKSMMEDVREEYKDTYLEESHGAADDDGDISQGY